MSDAVVKETNSVTGVNYDRKLSITFALSRKLFYGLSKFDWFGIIGGATTFSITALSTTTLSITTLSITTLSITTLSITIQMCHFTQLRKLFYVLVQLSQIC
jgi:hypothetical protein